MSIRRVRTLPPFFAFLFVNYHKRICRTKAKHSGGSISNPLETITRYMTSIDQMISSQPGIIPQSIGSITHAVLWEATVFVDHYSYYCYSFPISGTSAEETLQAKEAYELLESTHGIRLYAYREDNGMFS